MQTQCIIYFTVPIIVSYIWALKGFFAPFCDVILQTMKNNFNHLSWYYWLRKTCHCLKQIFHQIPFHKKSDGWLAVSYFSVCNLYNHLRCCPYVLYFFKSIEKNHLNWQFDKTSWFILTIDESSWCHEWYVTWFFAYIGYSFVVPLNYMFVIKVANIIDELICFIFPICIINIYR